MKRNSRFRNQASVLVVLSLLTCLVITIIGLSSVYSDYDDADSIKLSIKLDRANAEATYRLARLYHLNMIGEGEETETLYIDTLRHNPVHSPSWLGLSELYFESGMNKKAEVTLRRTLELIPSSIGLLWESSILAFRLGDEELAMENLKKVAIADPVRRKRVFDICWDALADQERILDGVIADGVLNDYLAYLIHNDRQNAAYAAWSRMVTSGLVSESDAFRYTDYLIAKDDIVTARSIWMGIYPNSKNVTPVWNGSFEKDPVGRGFDWRIGVVEGAKTDFDYEHKTAGARSLRISFSGVKNLDFKHVRQIIPVEPKTKYRITSDISTSNLTTNEGIKLQVFCKGLNVYSDTYTGNSGWTKASVSFVAPGNCNSVMLRLRRNKSSNFDNLISGEVWIDNVRLYELGPARDA